MTNNEKSDVLRLWISYPWMSREERNFSYLVSQLREANIEATYDSLQLLPNVSLRDRAAARLRGIGMDGWLYVLTHQCLTRKTCADELTGAIQSVMTSMGSGFPMAGLLYGISAPHIPPALRVHPCVSLSDPNWKQQLTDVLKMKVPRGRKKGEASNYKWKVHPCYGGDPSMTAVEVHSKNEPMRNWRFAVPRSVRPAYWGAGLADGHSISQIRIGEALGSGIYGNQNIYWFGATKTLTQAESAYVVFSGPLPPFIGFGMARGPFDPPTQLDQYHATLSAEMPRPSVNFHAGL